MNRRGWRIGKLARGMALAAGVCGALGLGVCQSPAGHVKPQAVMEVSAAPLAAMREVDNLATGTRWLLVRDPVHPAGPGRWVQMDERPKATQAVETAEVDAAPASGVEMPESAEIRPPAVILMRGGDPVIVEQSTPVLTARLTAVALEPATAGRLFRVRLKATGARVWAIAVGPGEARLAPPGVVGQ